MWPSLDKMGHFASYARLACLLALYAVSTGARYYRESHQGDYPRADVTDVKQS